MFRVYLSKTCTFCFKLNWVNDSVLLSIPKCIFKQAHRLRNSISSPNHVPFNAKPYFLSIDWLGLYYFARGPFFSCLAQPSPKYLEQIYSGLGKMFCLYDVNRHVYKRWLPFAFGIRHLVKLLQRVGGLNFKRLISNVLFDLLNFKRILSC